MRVKTAVRVWCVMFVCQSLTAFGEGALRVTTEQGVFVGQREEGLAVFRGMPYAQPPVGNLRWQPPSAPLAHTGERQAQRFMPVCIQAVRGQQGSVVGGEDCLGLNVWTPGLGDAKRPVMVWFHGGGLRSGSGLIAGEVLARQGVVVVSLNYRLGPLGFFAHPLLPASEANFGLQDMVAGLEWVQKNIAGFGGDPDKVTIFGVSAGGMAVNMLMVTPDAKGLFHRVIAQSGYGTWALPRSNKLPSSDVLEMDLGAPAAAEEIGASLVARINADLDGEDALRALPAADLVLALSGFQLPIVDGVTLEDEPAALAEAGRAHDVPLIMGGNSFEGSVMPASGITLDAYADYYRDFMPRVKAAYAQDFAVQRRLGLMRMFGDNRYLLAARVTGRAVAKGGNAAWLYYVDAPAAAKAASLPGTPHGADSYIFWNGAGSEDAEISGLAKRMQAYWLNFARNADPNGEGLIPWPSYDTGSETWLVFGAEDRAEAGVLADKLDLVEAHYRMRRNAR